MAPYTVRQAKTQTLGAAVVDTVTLTGSFSAVEIVHHGTVANPIYANIGATGTPTVAGDDEEVILPGERIRVPGYGTGGTTVVSMISAGAATYTVIGVA
jgi:hypothetical protein